MKLKIFTLFSIFLLAGCGVVGPSYQPPQSNQQHAILELQINPPTGSSLNPRTIYESGRIVSVDGVYRKPFVDLHRVLITPGQHTIGADCSKGNQAPIWAGGVGLQGENTFPINAKAGHTYLLAIYPANDQITMNSSKCRVGIKSVIPSK